MGRIANQYFSKPKGFLVTGDGSCFEGYLIGDTSKIGVGELVFNTSMSGYQEIITDPSYCGQIITFTNNNIGNVGCNKVDWESNAVFARGVVIRNYTDFPSNFRSEQDLDSFLKENGIIGIVGVDTIKVTHYLRDHGAIGAAIGSRYDELIEKASDFGDMLGKDFVTEVATSCVYEWPEGVYDYLEDKFQRPDNSNRPLCLVIDCGVKTNILRLLVSAGFRVKVWSLKCKQTLDAIYETEKFDSIFVSNGPGDPATQIDLIANLKRYIGKLPIFGICLGHQLLATALGGKTFKLKFGHRGGNHPVRIEESKLVEITVQNHGFAVLNEKFDANISHINLNDNTVEGIKSEELKLFSVQYHPESSPGPRDSLHYFKKFFELCQ